MILRVEADSEFTLNAFHLSHVFLTTCYHARSVVMCNPAVPEFEVGDSISEVLMLLKAWQDFNDTIRGQGFWYEVRAKVP
jgi:hypothetical protein